MAMRIECDMCGDVAGDDFGFYIVRSFGITLGDRIPVYANSCEETVICDDCWESIFRGSKSKKVVG